MAYLGWEIHPNISNIISLSYDKDMRFLQFLVAMLMLPLGASIFLRSAFSGYAISEFKKFDIKTVFIVIVSLALLVIVNRWFTSGYIEKDSISDIYSGSYIGLVVVAIVIINPFFEEMFFRGIIQRKIYPKYGAIASILFQACLVGIVGYGDTWIVFFFSALVLGYVYQITGSLWPSFFVHALNNLFSYLG